MNILSGLIEDYKGDIYFNNENLRNINKFNWYNKISIVPQNVFINEDTLLNNVILDQDKQTIKKEIDKANYAISKSGLNFFDEPVNNLDIENINIFKETLNEIKKDRIIIIIAHQKELYSFCDETIYIGEN